MSWTALRASGAHVKEWIGTPVLIGQGLEGSVNAGSIPDGSAIDKLRFWHPEAVVGALRENLAAIDQATSKALNDATEAARTGAAGIGGVGTPENYGAELAAMAQPRVDQARTAARGAADALGGRGVPEEYGARARQSLVDAKAAREEAEGKLWEAVDPDGTLNLWALGVAGLAFLIWRSTRKAEDAKVQAFKDGRDAGPA